MGRDLTPCFETISFRQVDLPLVGYRKTAFQNSRAPQKNLKELVLDLGNQRAKVWGLLSALLQQSRDANQPFRCFSTSEPHYLRQRRGSTRRYKRTRGTATHGPTTSDQVSKRGLVTKPRPESLGCWVKAFDLPLSSSTQLCSLS